MHYYIHIIILPYSTMHNSGVKRYIELGLADDPPEDCSTEDAFEVPEHFMETLESVTGWIDLGHTSPPPPLSLENIHQYFVSKHLRSDDVTATKPFEKGFRIYYIMQKST